MKTVSVAKFGAAAQELLEHVQRSGEEVLVVKRGKPVLKLVPQPERIKRTLIVPSPALRGRVVGDIVNAGEPEWLK